MSDSHAQRGPTLNPLTLRLDVMGGRLDGACMVVSSGRRLTLGAASNNDVVLRDPSVAAKQLALSFVTRDAGGVMLELEPLAAGVLFDSVELAIGETVRVAPGPVRIGELVISLQTDDEAATLEPLNEGEEKAVDPFESSALDDELVDDAPISESRDPASSPADRLFAESRDPASLPADHLSADVEISPLRPRSGSTRFDSWPRFQLADLAAVCIFLASVAYAISMSRDDAPTEVAAAVEAAEAASIGDALRTASLFQVQVEERAGALVATGAVSTREEAMELTEILLDSALPVRNETVVVADLVERVTDIFRVHGVEATVTSLGGTDVEAQTATGDIQTLTSVRETVALDLPDVGKLVVTNKMPPQPTVSVPGERSRPVEVQGKRVAMVVSDPPGYVVTEDKSRYFIGALLPSGHRISTIENGQVSLVKDGQSTVLDF